MKMLLNIIIGVLVIFSSYIGGCLAVERRLRQPKEIVRIQAEQTRERITDSARAFQKHLEIIAHEKRMDMLCAKDLELAITYDDRIRAVKGIGPFMRHEKEACKMDDSGNIVAVDKQ